MRHAADTVLARITGEQPAAINVGYFGQCIGLGRRAATAQLASKDDTANRFYIGGRLAAKIKELACKGMVKELADEARNPARSAGSSRMTTAGTCCRPTAATR